MKSFPCVFGRRTWHSPPRNWPASSVAVGTVISFPHGDSATETKVFESQRAIEDGAVELDMVLNIGWLLSGENAMVEADIRAVVEASGEEAIVKVILENAYLTDEQKVTACHLGWRRPAPIT